MVDLQQVVSSATFIPSNRQVRARTEFHARNPVGTIPAELTLDMALSFGAPASVSKWWSTPGFVDWWCSPSWEKEQAHAMLIQSMQRINEILRDEENPATVIAAAREARELYTKLTAGEKQKLADEEISKMSSEQLAEFIRRKTAVISGAK